MDTHSTWVRHVRTLCANYDDAVSAAGATPDPEDEPTPSTRELLLRFATPDEVDWIDDVLITPLCGAARELTGIVAPALNAAVVALRGTGRYPALTCRLDRLVEATRCHAEILTGLVAVTEAYGALVTAMDTDLTALVEHVTTGLAVGTMPQARTGATVVGAVASRADRVPPRLGTVGTILTSRTGVATPLAAATTTPDITATCRTGLHNLLALVGMAADTVADAYAEIAASVRHDPAAQPSPLPTNGG